MEEEQVLSGDTLAELMTSLRLIASADAALALGMDRDRMVVRTIQPGSRAEDAFPAGVDLAVWPRKVVYKNSGQSVEIAACPRSHIRQILEAAHLTGFGWALVFPVWTAATRAPLGGSDHTLTWPSGSISRRRGVWGPWEDGDRAELGGTSGVQPALRGGISLALSPFPEGWASGRPMRRWPSRTILLVLVFCTLAWFGARWGLIHRRTMMMERQRLEIAEASRQGGPSGCTVTDGARVLLRAASCASGIVLSHVVQSATAVTMTGCGTVTAVQAFADSMGANPRNMATTGEGSAVTFRMEVLLPCAD